MRYVFCCLLIAIGASLGATPAEARRVALVIGNAEYKVGPLANPLNDATAVAEALERQLKFDKVIVKKNLGVDAFRVALREFSAEAAGAEVGIVYFAGHGTEVGGKNFLIPVDAILAKPSSLDLEAIQLDTVLAQLDGVTRLKLVILDACRTNVFLPSAKRGSQRGLARIEPEHNMLVVYAAKDGTTADDGAGRPHSPFAEALLRHIGSPGLDVRRLFGAVTEDVLAATGGQQQPYLYGTFLGKQEFFLRPAEVASVGPPPSSGTVAPASEVERDWAAVKDSTSIPMLELFASRRKGTFQADLAQARISQLKQKAEDDRQRLALLLQQEEKRKQDEAKAAPKRVEEAKAAEQAFLADFRRRHPHAEAVGRAIIALGARAGFSDTFSSEHRLKLAEYQRRNGLVPSGYLDAATFAKLLDEPVNVALFEDDPSFGDFKTVPVGDWFFSHSPTGCMIWTKQVSVSGRFLPGGNILTRFEISHSSPANKYSADSFLHKFSGSHFADGAQLHILAGVSKLPIDRLWPPSKDCHRVCTPKMDVYNALAGSGTFNIVGPSIMGGDLTIQYPAKGFREAYRKMDAECASGRIGRWLK